MPPAADKCLFLVWRNLILISEDSFRFLIIVIVLILLALRSKKIEIQVIILGFCWYFYCRPTWVRFSLADLFTWASAFGFIDHRIIAFLLLGVLDPLTKPTHFIDTETET